MITHAIMNGELRTISIREDSKYKHVYTKEPDGSWCLRWTQSKVTKISTGDTAYMKFLDLKGESNDQSAAVNT